MMVESNQKINDKKISVWDRGTIRVIILAAAAIVLAVLITGVLSYTIAKREVVDKLKSRDLFYIAKSISARIDERIGKAVETSVGLAMDPLIIKWTSESEKDEALGQLAKQKLTNITKLDYSNSFIVSAITHHYWAEGGKLIDTMSKKDPDDSWFFNAISSKKPVSIEIDYNNQRKDTFVFVNALIGDFKNPIGISGVGLNLKEISKEFQNYKFGEKSNMWLVNSKGVIFLSEDIDQITENISELLPASVASQITANTQKISNVLEYKSLDGILYDLIFQPMTSTDWFLVLQIPRSESVSFVDTIKLNTGVACLVTLLFMTFIFYLVSKRIANPYKRAIAMSIELERLVMERTAELTEKNIKIMDSIEYAKMIQESTLPSSDELNRIFEEHFIIWKPRDTVGGDFYYAKSFKAGSILIVGDCTGHGVPGALMTMAVNSILDNILQEETIGDPAALLKLLNHLLKQTLYGKNSETVIDDGLDLAILYCSKESIIFSGARACLYIKNKDKLKIVRGNNKSIGYRSTSDEYLFENYKIPVEKYANYYITTDGYLHQNGGTKGFSLGRTRFEAIINNNYELPLSVQKEIFDKELKSYMGSEPQRDDITVIGFKCR